MAENAQYIDKWIGVEYFRMLLLKTFYRNADNKKYFNGSKSGILLFDYNTKQSEFGHLIAFILIVLLSIILLLKGHEYVFIWITHGIVPPKNLYKKTNFILNNSPYFWT
jgi:hypothetical protein